MKKSLKMNRAQQQSALEFLARHGHPIIRKHAAAITGASGPMQFTKTPTYWKGPYLQAPPVETGA